MLFRSTSYARDDASADEKLLIVARGCVIKTFKKMELQPGANAGKTRRDKFQIFMGLKDEAFIEMVKKYEEVLIQAGVENSKAWLDEKFDEGECRDMLKPIMNHHEKYGYAIGGILGREFTCKSKTDKVPDVSDLLVALTKNTIVDVCFWFNKIKLGAGKYSIGVEIKAH